MMVLKYSGISVYTASGFADGAIICWICLPAASQVAACFDELPEKLQGLVATKGLATQPNLVTPAKILFRLGDALTVVHRFKICLC